jgi:hypothetical protein
LGRRGWGARCRVSELLALKAVLEGMRNPRYCSFATLSTLRLPLVAAVCISDSGVVVPLAFSFRQSESRKFPLIGGRDITPALNLTFVDRSSKLLPHTSCSRSGSGSISLTASLSLRNQLANIVSEPSQLECTAFPILKIAQDLR